LDRHREAAAARWSSFDAFYRDEYRSVVGHTFALCGRWSLAEESVQEAFLRALARWENGELRHPEAWVRTVAVNLARSRMRRIGAEVRAFARRGPDRNVEDPDLIPAESTAFWAAVRDLPRRQGQAVALYYLEDRPVREVAGLMSCAEGTVKALLHQARERLADVLGPENGGVS
jgi:RNA polymerase sigma-70 factor, ECF subfamily